MAPERDAWMAAHPPGFVEYLEAFGPLGTYGKWIRTRMVLVRVNDTVFLHGGISPEVAPKKLESLNEQAQKEIARWDRMRKQMIEQQIALPSFTFEELLEAGGSELIAGRPSRRAAARISMDRRIRQRGGAGHLSHPLADLQEVGKWAILDPNGPLWFRGYATWRSEEGAPRLDELQRRYGPVRFVVGHTMTERFPRDGPILLARVPHRYGHAVVLLPGRPRLGARHPARRLRSRHAGRTAACCSTR